MLRTAVTGGGVAAYEESWCGRLGRERSAREDEEEEEERKLAEVGCASLKKLSLSSG